MKCIRHFTLLKASLPESLFIKAREVTGLQPAPKVLALVLFSSEFSEI